MSSSSKQHKLIDNYNLYVALKKNRPNQDSKYSSFMHQRDNHYPIDLSSAIDDFDDLLE